MTTVLIFLMIAVGVTAAWYQIYQMHFNINTLGETRLSASQRSRLDALLTAQQAASKGEDTALFEETATRIFGRGVNLEALRIAFSQDGRNAYGVPLLRRQRTLERTRKWRDGGDGIRVRHLRLFKTRLPSLDVRTVFILLVIANCGIVQLLAAMSVYTIHYSVGVSALGWVNQPVMILLAIGGVVVLNALIFTLDAYLHDLYQVGQLSQRIPLFD